MFCIKADLNTMKHWTTKAATGALFILSLLVSSVSACSCPHHEDAASPDATLGHLHSHSHEAESKREPSKGSRGAVSMVSPEDCCCMQPATKAAAKSEVIKSDGKVLKSSPLPSVERMFVSMAEVVQIGLETPSLLVESHRNLTPGRAPPRL